MFDELYTEFDEQRRNLEDQMYQEMNSLGHSDNEFNDLYQNLQQQRLDLEHELDQKRQQLEYEFDRKRMELEQEFRDDYEPYQYDEEYSEIEELKDRILANVSMDEIQSFWMRGDFEGLRDLIMSKTDLTEDEVKRVFAFFQKYEGDHRDYNDDRDGYQDYDRPNDNSGETDRLLQRIDQLEQENRELRDYLDELEQKLTDLNLIVMQQVQVIYEWVLSQ
jgi:hypothetical protein